MRVKKIFIKVFFASLIVLLTGCIGGPSFYPNVINQIIWSPDQKYLVFSYSNLRKYPPPGTPAPMGVMNVPRTILYKINLDGSEVKQIFDPVVALNLDARLPATAVILGWAGSRLRIFVEDTFYLFDPLSGAVEKTLQYSALKSSEHQCLIQEKWFVFDAEGANGSSILNLENSTDVHSISMEKSDVIPPVITSCSPDGQHVYYEKHRINNNEMYERGIAELDPEKGVLKNPAQLFIKSTTSKSRPEWYRLIAWIAPQTLLHIVSRDPSPDLKDSSELVEFHYPSGELSISQNHFLGNDIIKIISGFGISPDYKQVAFVEDGIEIANIDGSQRKTIRKNLSFLPQGELYTIQ